MTLSSPAEARPTPTLTRIVERVGIHNLSLILALVVLLVIFGTLRGDVFFSTRNILNIGMGVAILGVLAISQTAVIVSGGLDISVGSIVGLSTVATAMAIQQTDAAGVGIAAGLAIGAMAGLVNGLLITYGRINAVIVTLGTMAIFRGVAFILSNGQSISIFNDAFRWIGIGRVMGLPAPIWILILVAVAFYIFMHKSIKGRNLYAIGGNPVVARLSGMNLTAYRVSMYILSGFVAGIAGILLAARTGSGQPISGSQGLELEAITAAFLGGCAMQGGKGTVVGALLGVAIIGILNNGMILTSVPTFYQMLAKGTLLILAVFLAEYRLNKS
ncbi:ABC transporter permease [Acuticoccus sp. MNP-M23]|uniref:ABC transporter permease n=1 Tax=Acuticoccus sp. MNP-M23 TaxID=3072793 RepID=UPI002815D258|nr:ABC transporter permease [Acuticoccus sp. MNP-M23]WMS43556.1 ABC transporter permease [Acuticoccus sp. MNP-M23]